tara:strand:- start:793 stop:1095 length:303 start_codon:yes stop_codon:yes gene_type:complete
MNDYNLWLEETGRTHWCELSNTMVVDVDINDPAIWEEYLSSQHEGVTIDDGDDDDLCDASDVDVLIDDEDDDEYWFEADGGLTGEAMNYLSEQDANGDFV